MIKIGLNPLWCEQTCYCTLKGFLSGAWVDQNKPLHTEYLDHKETFFGTHLVYLRYLLCSHHVESFYQQAKSTSTLENDIRINAEVQEHSAPYICWLSSWIKKGVKKEFSMHAAY